MASIFLRKPRLCWTRLMQSRVRGKTSRAVEEDRTLSVAARFLINVTVYPPGNARLPLDWGNRMQLRPFFFSRSSLTIDPQAIPGGSCGRALTAHYAYNVVQTLKRPGHSLNNNCLTWDCAYEWTEERKGSQLEPNDFSFGLDRSSPPLSRGESTPPRHQSRETGVRLQLASPT